MSKRTSLRHALHRAQRRALRPLAATLGVITVVLSTTPAQAATLQSAPMTGTWGTNGRVTRILPVGNGQVIIAGAFTALTDPRGGSHPAANIALLDASGAAVSSFAAGTDGEVDALALQGRTVYLGGKFDRVDGQSHRKLAAVDLGSGAVLAGFTAVATGQVFSLAVTPTALFVSGSFGSVRTKAQGTVARPYVAKLDPTTGDVDLAWAANPDAKVRSVIVSPDFATVYLGGDFTYLGSSFLPYTAALSTAAPAAVRSYRVITWAPVLDQAYDNGDIYLAIAGWGGSCASFDATTGARNWWYDTDGNVQAVTAYDGMAYCGGHFAQFGNYTARQHIAAVSLTYPYSVTGWNPGTNSALGVYALANDGSTLSVGGDFTKIGGQLRAHFARFQP